MVNSGNTELKKEKVYLEVVYQELLAAEKELSALIAASKAEGTETLKSIAGDISSNFDSVLDNLDTFSMIEIKNREIDQMNLKLRTADVQLQKVQRLLESAYFGKVDLDFLDEEPLESFYIGINNFSNEVGDNRVYDWRSPIAETFYNNQLGASSYSVNGKLIEVGIQKRRQYKIRKNQLISYFDTSTAIQDDVLFRGTRAGFDYLYERYYLNHSKRAKCDYS